MGLTWEREQWHFCDAPALCIYFNTRSQVNFIKATKTMHHIRFVAGTHAAPVSRLNAICRCDTSLWSFHVTGNVKTFVPSVKLEAWAEKGEEEPFKRDRWLNLPLTAKCLFGSLSWILLHVWLCLSNGPFVFFRQRNKWHHDWRHEISPFSSSWLLRVSI